MNPAPPSPLPAPLSFSSLHHVAIICTDYAISRDFYTRILGFSIIAESFRKERNSWKLDMAGPGGTQIELFSFPNPPPRPSMPEAAGLRHLAFATRAYDQTLAALSALGVSLEPTRVDENTGKRFTFFKDPDGLPIEVYEG